MTALPDAAGEPHTIYTGSSTNWPVVAVTSVLAVVVIAMGWTGDDDLVGLAIPVALVLIGIVGNVLTASSVRAAAGPNGFDLRWGIVGWPHCTYPLDAIERAEVVQVPWRSVSYGFWWTPRQTCCTIRPGEALRLWLTDGRKVTVTVPEPDDAVRVLALARETGRTDR